MTLTEFLDMYTLKEPPIIVFDFSVYDEVWDKMDDGEKIDELGVDPEFAILPKWTQYRAFGYLNETFANAEVKRFTFTDEGMIIFIETKE